ncbi:group II intron reverse transcriptase/maturase [Pradoshia eiseniae]|uniref:RNA-directed DNA polymerase n=1 Tax=Pradoshia eiseniae TaxID=2064768 RepID=A0A2S7N0J8_9BACI|nr:group II intron reverse transcriptase/maturase [Pradoshia eiseniae]PQD95612.1 group II intron reverse transcriptase/maturase [Pradoshia eiseniae]
MLLNQILSRENMLLALKRVEKNKGSHGVDEMPVQSLRQHLIENWSSIREAILEGTYEPMPVRRVEIPKPDGGIRLLGIPTVTDRLIQQAIAQEISKIYDPMFSEHSYGFRPNRSAHDAVRKAKGYIQDGYRWVVDMDLEKFFDKVNHDRLMSTLAKKIAEKPLLKLIRGYLQAGVMIDGVVSSTEKGTPQGGPLSPLLSNIVLDELDKELESRGHRFVRYADDCNIYVKSKRAGERTLASIQRFIEGKLRLKVNKKKSAVDRPWKRKFLGFTFTSTKELKIRIAKASVQRMKEKVRKITSRKMPYPMEYRIQKLNQYLTGWCGYFALADTKAIFGLLDKWIRRRLRMCMWKNWKNPKAKIRHLMNLGVPKGQAYEWGNSRKGYWRISKSPILHKALGNTYWYSRGLKSLQGRYETLRHQLD